MFGLKMHPNKFTWVWVYLYFTNVMGNELTNY